MIQKRLSDNEYKFVYGKVPRLCVDLAIKTDQGLVLTKRSISPFKNTWHFPGGRVLYRESIPEAIKRIANNEIGVQVEIKKLIGYLEVLKDGKFVHSVSMVFEIKVKRGKITVDRIQAKKVKAFKKLPPNTHPYHRKFIEKYLL